tara:strand:+ start:7571 stop:7696 length:126 start_codon:yes stop_codon:yes gene_type:complete
MKHHWNLNYFLSSEEILTKILIKIYKTKKGAKAPFLILNIA